MVDCSSFTSSVDCVLTLTNDYNIKLWVLSILVFYSVLGVLFYNKINIEKSYMHFWTHYLTKVLSYGFLIFTPLFFVLLLRHDISLEIFITIIISFYLMFTSLFIGMSVYYGSSHAFKMFGFDDWNEFKDNMKDKKSLKKYG